MPEVWLSSYCPSTLVLRMAEAILRASAITARLLHTPGRIHHELSAESRLNWTSQLQLLALECSEVHIVQIRAVSALTCIDEAEGCLNSS